MGPVALALQRAPVSVMWPIVYGRNDLGDAGAEALSKVRQAGISFPDQCAWGDSAPAVMESAVIVSGPAVIGATYTSSVDPLTPHHTSSVELYGPALWSPCICTWRGCIHLCRRYRVIACNGGQSPNTWMCLLKVCDRRAQRHHS